MAKTRCWQCASGRVAGEPAYYDPDCYSCRKKKEAGLRTGLEPKFLGGRGKRKARTSQPLKITP